MFIDMPLSDLKQYQGISPKPDDFDVFWQRSLKELDEVDPEPELFPASFQAPGSECFDLWFTGIGGARIHAKYLRPETRKQAAPAVLSFHGYFEDCGNWSSKLSYTGAGFCVAALDCRGQGGLSEDRGVVKGNTVMGHIIRGLDSEDKRDLMYRSIFLDTVQLARVVKSFDEVDESKLCTIGYSQGGALAAVCAALVPEVRIASVTYPFLSDFKRAWEMGLSCLAYRELQDYFRYKDPRHLREDEVFHKLGYIDVHNFAPMIRAKVLFFTGLSDETVPASTQFAVYNNLKTDKELYVYPEYSHELIPESLDISFRKFLDIM